MYKPAAPWLLAASLALACAAAIAAEPAASPRETSPPPVGSTLPPIQLSSSEGEPFDLNAAVAERPTILVLYRGGW